MSVPASALVTASLLSSAVAVLLCVIGGGIVCGCSSSSRSSSAPTPGSGIAEYRTLANNAHQAVGQTVSALNGLAKLKSDPSSARSALSEFDRSFQQLEITSLKTRARAEAIMMRGEAYFAEWKMRLGDTTNGATGHAEEVRYNRLHQHFDLVRERSGKVRTEFRTFMNGLREHRALLDKTESADGQFSQAQLETLIANGQRVLGGLESLTKSLDDAELELRAMLASKQ